MALKTAPLSSRSITLPDFIRQARQRDLAGAVVDLAGQVLDTDDRGDDQRDDEQPARPVELVLALVVALVIHENALYTTPYAHNLP